MLRSRIAFLTIAGILGLALVGCGGGGSAPQLGASNQVAQAVAPQPGAGLRLAGPGTQPVPATWFDQSNYDDLPRLGGAEAAGAAIDTHHSVVEPPDPSLLGELPPYEAAADGQPRAASEVRQVDISSPAAATANVVAAPGSLDIPAAAGTTEWARFMAQLNGGEELVAFSVTGTLVTGAHGADSGLWVGLSNYSVGYWQFFGPYDLSSQAIVNLDPANYADSSDTVHLVLLATDGDEVNISQLQIDAQGAGPGEILPPEFYTALTNVGLNPAQQSMSVIMPGLPGPNMWNWTGYNNMWTMLDSYWLGWYGFDEPFNPQVFPQYLKDKGEELDTAADLQELLLSAVDEFPEIHHISEQSHTETLDPTDPLARAIEDFVDAVGGTSDFPTYQAALAPLSLEDQQALAVVIYAAIAARTSRNDSIGLWGLDNDNAGDLFNWGHGGTGLTFGIATEQWYPNIYLGYGDPPGGVTFWHHFDYATMFEGAAVLADAIDDLTEYMGSNPVLEDVNLEVDTPEGKVVIGSTGDDTHAQAGDGNGHAILIDLGGNDTYNCHAGGTASPYNGIAVCLDLAGDDVYNALDDPDDMDRSVGWSDDNTSQQGAGRVGIGMLVDYGGSDEYHSVRLSQGCGVFGVGICADYGQSSDMDTYAMECLGQGGAMGGVGILYDSDGEDSYDAWSRCQGFGGTMGVGLLVDHGMMDDTYNAHPEEGINKPEYYSDTYGTNMSISQGGSWGIRRDWLQFNDGENDHNVVASGGYGLLFDQAGFDSYTCGTFGQAFALYQGLGILIDLDGQDDYQGHWYTQGATAHFALSGFWEGAGDDSYDNEVSVGIGGAHDRSITWFLEREGNDMYQGSSLSLGTGNANAFGYFIEYLGHDQYFPTYTDGEHYTLGRAVLGDSTTPDVPGYGIFVDSHGADTYDPVYAGMIGVDTPPADGEQWTRTGDYGGDGGFEAGLGSGIDGQ